MIFEFVIVYHREDGVSIREILLERLRLVLNDNLNQFDDDATSRMIIMNYERTGEPTTVEMGVTRWRTVLGLSIDLPDETESIRTVVDDFADALMAAPIEHVVKFEDPLLWQELAQRANELFALEMKLRRVITVMYIHGYIDRPYELLREETEQPINTPQESHMRALFENEFFFLTLGQYVNLNRRPDMRQLPTLINLIQSNETYDALRRELSRQPVEDEDDSVFLAGLRERMNSIETIRNCVAHNRRPSQRMIDNYLNALPQVEAMLDQVLSRWELPWQDDGEMPWDRAAREAVEEALRNSDWDDEDKSITFYNAGDRRIRTRVYSREELESHLCTLAETAFYASAPRADGASVFDCEGGDVVAAVLQPYEERLTVLFEDVNK